LVERWTLRGTQGTLDSGSTKGHGNGRIDQFYFGQRTQGNSYGAQGDTGRTREEGWNIFIEALRRQLECRSCDKRILSVQKAHDEGTPSLEEGTRQAWAPAIVRVGTISGEQIRIRTVTYFLKWRPSSETHAAALRRGCVLLPGPI
jgi:hypothetical protein